MLYFYTLFIKLCMLVSSVYIQVGTCSAAYMYMHSMRPRGRAGVHVHTCKSVHNEQFSVMVAHLSPQDGRYSNLRDIQDDLLLIVKNAHHFNEPNSIIYKVRFLTSCTFHFCGYTARSPL